MLSSTCTSQVLRFSIEYDTREVWWQSFIVKVTKLSRATCFVFKGNFSGFDVIELVTVASLNLTITICRFWWAHRSLVTSRPLKLLLETKEVALDNMVTLTLKLCHQTSLVSYSTENRSKWLQREKNNDTRWWRRNYPAEVVSQF